MNDNETLLPPHDIHAEQATIGAAMHDPEIAATIATVLTERDFFRPAHGLIWAAIEDLLDAGKPVDAVTVLGALGTVTAARCGGAAYMFECLQAPPAASSGVHYAEIVAAHAVRRQALEASVRIRAAAYSGGDVEQLLELMRSEAERAAGQTSVDDESLADMAMGVLTDIEQGKGLLKGGVGSGYTDLDHYLRPFTPGQFVIVGARPGAGKSVFATDLARHMAFRALTRVTLVSLEMEARELTHRVIAAEARVTLDNLQHNAVDDAGWQRIAAAHTRMSDDRLTIRFRPGASVATLRQLVRETRPQVLIVDYLQLMATGRAPNRQEAISELSRGLKLLAQQEGITVIALCQLNRAADGRSDRKPAVSDLRESGSLEQDADAVVLLHRPEMYDREDRPGECDVILAKQRSGTSGVTVALASQLHYCRFTTMAHGV